MIRFYDRTSSQESVNQVHKQLLIHKGRAINELLPPMDFFLQLKLLPTQASWSLITQAFQSGHSWGKWMFAPPQHPSPSDWGQKQSSPDLIAEATQACFEGNVPERKVQMYQGITSMHGSLLQQWIIFSEVAKICILYTCIMFLFHE